MRQPIQRVRIKSPSESTSPELLSSPLAKLDLDDSEYGIYYAEPALQLINSDDEDYPFPLQLPHQTGIPTTPTRALHTTSPNSNTNSIIDLCTPPNPLSRKPKDNDFDFLAHKPYPLTKLKDEIIDLSILTPSHKIPKPKRVAFSGGITKPEPMHEIIDVDAFDSPSHRSTRHKPTRNTTVSSGPIKVGSVFASWEEARDAIYHQEELRGFKMQMGQSKLSTNREKKKITVCCDRYSTHEPKKQRDIDPSEFHEGKSAKTGCFAHWNVNRLQDTRIWHITLIDNHHNHDHDITPRGFATRPPTQAQRELVSELAADSIFTRAHLSKMLKQQHPDHPLEPRQISNIIDKVRREGREEVRALGRDIPLIISAYDANYTPCILLTSPLWQRL